MEPEPPTYLFVRGDRALAREYERGIPLPEIFPVHGVGIVTGRDALATALDRTTLERRLSELMQAPAGPQPAGCFRAVEALRGDGAWRCKIARFLARPFDLRSIFYADYFLARPRRRVMDSMGDESSLGLVVPRQCKEEPGALVTRWMIGHKVVSAHDVSTLFPLYFGAGAARRPNVATRLEQRLGDLLGNAPAPETILAYVYAVLYNQTWRHRYRELLRRDFPRIPLPSEPELFLRLAAAGRELTALHLLEDARLHDEGSLPELGAIDSEIWACRVGGYRVLQQWLRARRGRNLSAADTSELRRIAEALRCTRAAQAAMSAAGLSVL